MNDTFSTQESPVDADQVNEQDNSNIVIKCYAIDKALGELLCSQSGSIN